VCNLLFPLQSKPVEDKNLQSQKQTGGFTVVQRSPQEAHRAAPVHGGARHIERKAGDRGVHQDAKVVAEVSSSDTKSPHARDYKGISDGEKPVGNVRLVHGLVVWLVLQGSQVQMVTEDSQGEDGDGEEVTAIVWAPEYAG
jgi:hypothetical protein